MNDDTPNSSARDLVRQGMERQQAGDLDGASACYRQALELQPDNADALHLSGLVALQQGDPDEAVVRIQHAVDRVPDHPVLRNNLGLAMHRAGTLVAAAGQLQKALELKPGDAGAHMNLGAVFSDLGDRESALEHGLEAVERDPERADIGRRKYSQRKAVPELTSERDEGRKRLVDSCIKGLDRIGVSKRGKSSLARPEEGEEACSQQVPKNSEHENSGKR